MFFFDYTIFLLPLVQYAQTTAVSTFCATPVLSTCTTPGWWVKYDHLNEKMYTSATCNLSFREKLCSNLLKLKTF
ncbi:uncharacterized protein LOC105843121 isoform X2 [Hydra vulgaris]|uniref:uncharacterized protein LOC105843121 isoform X2 n=1 Tax=Hydra vulgaris TaxID=6087 RepID=UPI0032EA66D8